MWNTRGALIGGIVGLLLHYLARFVIRNLFWVALGVVCTLMLAKCTPETPRPHPLASGRAQPAFARAHA
jgi:hypothetical protein